MNERIKALELDYWDECLGILRSADEDEGRIVLVIGGYELVLPKESIEHERLRSLLGKRVGLLRTGLVGKEYLIKAAVD